MRMRRVFLLPLRAFFLAWFLYRRSLAIASCFAVLVLFFAVLAIRTLALPVLALSVALIASLRSDLTKGSLAANPPKVALNVRGGLECSGNCVRLGSLICHVPRILEVIVHNTSSGPLRNVQLSIASDRNEIQILKPDTDSFSLEPGGAVVFSLKIASIVATARSSKVDCICRWEGGEARKLLVIDRCLDPVECVIEECRIDRWKHGARGAVCWRADLDGLDNISNEATLSVGFELARRYRVPISLFISSRLCLDYQSWRQWVRHFPGKWDEGDDSRERFERFVSFIKALQHSETGGYPAGSPDAPGKALHACVAQVGNHMHYHYHSGWGYDASPDTGWRSNVSPGQFIHAWQDGGSGEDVRAELLANASRAQEVIKRVLGIVCKSWAAPGDVPHPQMPWVLDQLGMPAASEATRVARPRLGTLLAPLRPDLGPCMPFHPSGFKVIETLAHMRRFDPHTRNELTCAKLAVERALDRGVQVTLLIHPHLRLYSNFFGRPSSERHVEELLRFLIHEKGSQAWIATHYAVASYWEKVLCPQHRCIRLSWTRREVLIENVCAERLEGVPVRLKLENGCQSLLLVELEPRAVFAFDLSKLGSRKVGEQQRLPS